MEGAIAGPSRIAAPERRAVLLRAAGRLFGERGYAGTRLDDVAAAAGVTKPIVYRHFGSKKALYLALLDRHEADLPAFFEGESDTRAILAGWLDYVKENRYAWLMLFRDTTGDDEIKERRLGVSERAREVLAGFIASGPAALPTREVEPTAELLTGGLAALALWWIEHPDVPKQVVLDVAARVSGAALTA